MKNILITGGAGFVGSSLTIKLKQSYADTKIIALDNLKRRGSELNIQRLRKYGIDFIHGDIRNPEDLMQIGHVDLIIECAAEPSVLAGFDGSPAYVVNTNLVGTLNCLELARRNQSDFIFLSTSRVYPMKVINSLKYDEDETRFSLTDSQNIVGASSQGFTEEFPLLGTRSLYGATKLASEYIIQEYLEMYDLRGVINRCGIITGPWQMGKVDQGVVVLWVARHVYGGNLNYIGFGGTGKQVRDVLHIDDLYNLIDVQIKMLDDISGEVFNAGGGLDVSVSLKELTALCEESSGKRIEIGSIADDRADDIRIYITDNTKVAKVTGWSPKHGVNEIVEETVKWLRNNEQQLRPILA